MRRLGFITTFVIVFAIVVTAFAFTAKKAGSFCVTHNIPDRDCYVLQNFMIVPGTPTYYYNPNWNGNIDSCLYGHKCGTPVRLAFN